MLIRPTRPLKPFTRRGKGTKIVAIAAGDGLPLAVSVEGASHGCNTSDDEAGIASY
jgi:hypothetical protein